MIFVTVGTHEQQFDRLIKEIDNLCKEGIIKEEVYIQIGYSDYEPKNCKWSKFLSYDEMLENVKKARIVITHGGPSSFIMPLQINKIPIVVPRKLEFKEHINNHQVDFVKKIKSRMNNIIPVYDIDKLGDIILNYDLIAQKNGENIENNNLNFNKKIENIVEDLLMKKGENNG